MESIRVFLFEQFAKEVKTITQYAGEINLNFKCTLSDGSSYNLKLFHPSTSDEFIDFLCKAHVHCRTINCINTPDIISWKSGRYINQLEWKNEHYKAVLLEWVDGKLLSELSYHPPSLLKSWGELCAKLQDSLSDFNHPYLTRKFEWDSLQLELHADKISYLKSSKEEAIIKDIFKAFKASKPLFNKLKESINHNDLHTENLLIAFNGHQPEIIGLIDFGDALKTARISDFSIACAYAMMNKKDPLKAVGHLLKGYTEQNSLKENEIQVLDTLIRSRLAISVLTSAKKRHDGITEEYQFVSEKKAWHVLEILGSYPKNFIHYYYRAAAGYEACPQHSTFKNWCKKNQSILKNILQLDKEKCKSIDLSVSSKVIPATGELEDVALFQKRIGSYLETNNLEAAYGGYGEIRPVYTTDNYETENDEGYQWRTQHLGLDVWTSIHDQNGNRRKLFSPLDGEVICSFNNDVSCDYGATLILKHSFDNLTFYTLYGHLSFDSLALSYHGKKVKAGDHIAYLGDKDENGNWPPHLHFQVMLDLLGNKTNYPGVAYTYEWDIWKSICPNPLLLYPSMLSPKIERVNQEALIQKRKKLLGKNLSVSYKNNLTIVRGHMQYLYDINGRRYLDTVNNVAHVGHEHTRITKAVIEQVQLLNTNSRYLHPEILYYAEKLLDTFPKHFTRVYFTNSGSESNELALRIAASKTNSTEKLVLKMGYHGNTSETVEVSSYKFERKGGKGKPSSVSMLDYYSDESKDSKETYLKELEEIIALKGSMSFIHESILSCAGQVELDSEVLRSIYQMIQKSDGVCIADEVQTGFGRVGHSYWAFEIHAVKPDIVTMGKPIGNGHPLGAVVCTEELAESFDNGMEYFNTYGGNPVSMKIGNEVLDIVQEEGFMEHAKEMEAIFYREVKKLKWPATVEAKTRGKGLFLGIELMESGKEATRFASYIKNRMRERGILMSTDGLFENVLKIKPPMVFNENDLNKLMKNLQLVSNEYAELIS